ncbi:ABC transporter permease subunit [Streptomyces tsukubensis]|uniref:ABC transporter permease n=2 Tax=Streptomyces tsukubensis TaxID=83656 RepID=A0A1V3ZYU6_9ACTN|nr:ABC transporter permease [Streptomyces tsukubensis]QFR93248.1 ABC transporter permease subunit [Streptomyces tsukubensis]
MSTAVSKPGGSAPPQAGEPGPARRGPGLLTRLRRSFATHWYAWAMVLPVVVVLAVLVGYPLGRGLYLSFTDADEANIGRVIGDFHVPATYRFVGLDNYWNILSGKEGSFYPRLGWTVVWTASCVLLHYSIGLGLAMLLNRPMRGRSLYRVLLILPWAVPAFVAAFAWKLMYNTQNGVINAVLAKVGVGAVDWLGDPFVQKLSVIAVNTWLGVPFMMVAILGGLQAIPRELHEAAEMDGASPWQRFRNVTLPGLRPVSGTVVLLGTIWTFNMFPIIYLVIGQAGGTKSEILVTYAYRLAFQGVRDYAGSASYGIVILSLLLVFSVFHRRMLSRQEGSL